jgi:hypothetical protein
MLSVAVQFCNGANIDLLITIIVYQCLTHHV